MDIAYIPLDENLIQSFSENISYSFSKNETLTKALKVTHKDLQPAFSFWLEHSLEHSYVAKDLQTDRIVGGLLCNDFTFFLNAFSSGTISVKMQAIIELLSTLEDRFIKRVFSPISSKNFLYHYALYVDEEYSNQGIAKNLYRISQKNAYEKGFKNIIAILTGIISQHLYLNRLGFNKVDELIYKDFCFRGQHILSNIEPKACILAIKSLESS